MMRAKGLSEDQVLSLDIISTLPHGIIENILCFLPIQEAARTSILSREWRYKWTKIPKLEFCWSTVSETTSEETETSEITSARKNMDMRCKLFYAIQQVLLMRQGPIHEFTLCMEGDRHCVEIDLILLHLSRNHPLKKLKLALWGDNQRYKLPLCAFSLCQLIDLDLRNIDLDHQPIISGFGNLRTLFLYDVLISTKSLLHLLSNCPSIASFSLYAQTIGDKDCSIIELFECLPMIEHLHVYAMGSLLEMLVLDSVPKELPTSLIHLKYVCLEDISPLKDMFRFLVVLFKSSPNLEKVSLVLADLEMSYDSRICSGILEEYSNVWLEHLHEMDIGYCTIIKPQIEFVKFILARSPMLKKVWISGWADSVQEELELLKILKHAPHASPVEIVVEIDTESTKTETLISLEN